MFFFVLGLHQGSRILASRTALNTGYVFIISVSNQDGSFLKLNFFNKKRELVIKKVKK